MDMIQVVQSSLLTVTFYLTKITFKFSLIGLFIWLIKEIFLGLCRSKKRLDGKIILMTGGDVGVGFEVAKNIASRGAFLILASQNIKKLQSARDKIAEFSGNEKVIAMKLDLGSFQSIIEFSGEFKAIFNKIDFIINNAGIGVHLGSRLFGENKVPSRVLSSDGFEIMMQVNYIGPFLLFDLLNDLFKDNSRIINVIHPLYLLSNLSNKIDLNVEERNYDPDLQFSNSNMALALFGEEMKRIHGLISINVIPSLLTRTHFYTHSFPVYKQLFNCMSYIIGKNAWQASQSIIAACLMSEHSLERYRGPIVLYDCRQSQFWIHSKLRNEELSKTLCYKTVEALNQCT